jgi:hypothetical protein
MAVNRVRTPKTDEKVTNEMIQSVRRQVHSLEIRAASEDPWLAAELLNISRETEAAAVRAVGKLRAVGYTWPDVGLSFGISGQTALKWYNRKISKIGPQGNFRAAP